MRNLHLLALAAFVLCPLVAEAQPGRGPGPGRPPPPRTKPAPRPKPTQLTWYGHAAFRVDTPSGKTILIDPWITNPKNPRGKADLAALRQVDLILVTHGHGDHVGDAVAIAKKTGARLVTTFDLGKGLVAELGFPGDRLGFDTQGNFGGEVTLLGGEVTVRFVPAVHSSTVSKDDTAVAAAGSPGGFVIAVRGGPVLYHTGDTDVFGDMAYIGADVQITHMLACIGGHFTMGPAGAAEAARLVKPLHIVPMHFGTFPVLTGTVDQLRDALTKKGVTAKVLPLEIGRPTPL
ncbi:MAG: metal-dependent hydrolase [Kofleriaceae bacterium]|nr:metal-dependent hydrolase [Kofleriaceae bacterium]MCL4226311.1 metal-dependent hydrolase [Myxococcales bacterium]